MITVYTTKNCPQCDTVKRILESRKISFDSFLVGVDISRDEIVEQFPTSKSFPIIHDGVEGVVYDFSNVGVMLDSLTIRK
jgi:glutaredoxin